MCTVLYTYVRGRRVQITPRCGARFWRLFSRFFRGLGPSTPPGPAARPRLARAVAKTNATEMVLTTELFQNVVVGANQKIGLGSSWKDWS